MEAWRAENFCWASASEWVLRETVISTMEPEVMEGGSRMEGNSIWSVISIAGLFHEAGVVGDSGRGDVRGAYPQ